VDEHMKRDIGIGDQLEFFDSHVADVDLASIFLDVEEDAKELARERMVKYFPKYGDGNFHKTLLQLRREQMEEIADAINYQIFKEWVQENGEE
jgi:hypothetical protein